MAYRQETTKYGTSGSDPAALDPEFSLEDILAEYGNSREQKLMQAVEQEVNGPETDPAAQEAMPEPKSVSEKLPEPVPEEIPSGEPDPADLPPAPKPISLEEIVGSTVEAVMEENASRAEQAFKEPRRKLFSRRKLEETEKLYDTGKHSEPEEFEVESIGPEEDPFDAAERYRKEHHSLSVSVLPAFLIALLAIVPMAVEQYGIEIPYWTGDLQIQCVVELACLAISAVLCRGVFVKGFSALRRKRCESELMIAMAVPAVMGDSIICLLGAERTAVIPYAPVACLALAFAQLGVSRERRALYDTFHAAAVDEPPYLVTDTAGGACKQRGALPGFYSSVMQDDAVTLWQTALLPVVLMGTFVFAGLSSLGQGRGADFLLNWSVLLLAGGTCALPLCWGMPFARFARHLQRMGCAVAGWSGAEKLSRRKTMIITDADLFPPGTIQLNGIKIYGEERRKIAAYASAMASQSGSGLERLFDTLLHTENAHPVKMQDFRFYEEGGWAGEIRGETVLMGTASFMRKMEVRLPADIRLKTGIYMAIDRQLAAVFAVKYHPAENVDLALRMMRTSHILPVLASRDPNITPGLLKRKFHKSVKVEYPDLASRMALSEAEQDRDLPRALLFREGLMPYAETVVGSRRLCQAVRRGTIISLIGSILGTLLVFYLVFQAAYLMITPVAVEAFLLLWTLPVFLLADWTGRY